MVSPFSPYNNATGRSQTGEEGKGDFCRKLNLLEFAQKF